MNFKKKLSVVTYLLSCMCHPIMAQAPQPAPPADAEKAQNPSVITAYQTLEHDQLVERNLDPKQSLNELKSVIGILDNAEEKYQLPNLTGKLKIIFSKDRAPLLALQTVPKIGAQKHQEIVKVLQQKMTSHAKMFETTLILTFKIGKGDPQGHIYAAEPSAHEQRLAKIKKADLVECHELIKGYARTIAIPYTTAVLLECDPKFKGVKTVGEVLSKLDLSKPVDVKKTLDENHLYWVGCMEMQKNNPLVSSTRILLHTLNGNFDHANRYLSIHSIFGNDKTVSSLILRQLSEMLMVQDLKVQAEINKGIKLHDQQKFDEAAQVYQKLLAKYPFSAHGRYELWFAQNTQQLFNKKNKAKKDDDFASWKAAQKEIYSIDPLYGMDVRAKSAREQFMMIRRMEMKLLLSKPMNSKALIEYADIAKDLGVYNFAAELYLVIASNIAREHLVGKDIGALYFYCVHQAGAQKIAEIYKGSLPDLIKKEEGLLERRIRKKKPESKDSK